MCHVVLPANEMVERSMTEESRTRRENRDRQTTGFSVHSRRKKFWLCRDCNKKSKRADGIGCIVLLIVVAAVLAYVYYPDTEPQSGSAGTDDPVAETSVELPSVDEADAPATDVTSEVSTDFDQANYPSLPVAPEPVVSEPIVAVQFEDDGFGPLEPFMREALQTNRTVLWSADGERGRIELVDQGSDAGRPCVGTYVWRYQQGGAQRVGGRLWCQDPDQSWSRS